MIEIKDETEKVILVGVALSDHDRVHLMGSTGAEKGEDAE